MTTYAFPSIAPNESTIRQIWRSKTFESPFTGARQTVGRAGDTLQVLMRFRTLTAAQRRQLEGFIAQLHGQEHRFTVHDHSHAQGGTLNGTPLVNGASQTGDSIVTDGWDLSETVLLQGDHISIASYLYIVTADVTSDGSGNATIPVFPSIPATSPVNNAPIDTSSPVGTFMLEGSTFDIHSRPGPFSDLVIVGTQDVLQ